MRSILYRFPDLDVFEELVGSAADMELELGLPANATACDGEWVLAIFELGPGRRATSAAAQALVAPDGTRLLFEPRDWRKLAAFSRTDARSATAGSMAPPPPSAAPRSAESERPPSTARSGPPPPSSTPSRVLVVDDDPDIREVVTAMLEAVGLEVFSAASAEEALARVGEERYDLLVLDWNLPKMTGVELCRILRKETATSALPVLFLTANAASQDMVEAFASGADDFVTKPFRAPELGARIFSLLRRSRRTTA